MNGDSDGTGQPGLASRRLVWLAISLYYLLFVFAVLGPIG
jgi:hypothetical protein